MRLVDGNSVEAWFEAKGWSPHAFQMQTWQAFASGRDGLVQAPTGMGKTYSVLGGVVQEALSEPASAGIQVIWIAPIRALTKEIAESAARMLQGVGLEWTVGIRTGDTSQPERARQRRKLPHLLITTPESLHLLMAQSDHADRLATCRLLVVDEWHALIGTKRGVQVELAASHLRAIAPRFRTWGLTATIGNLDEAMEVLCRREQRILIRSDLSKVTEVISLMPSAFERLAWSGFLGVALRDQVLNVVHHHRTTLVFTNTRSQAEIWYHRLLEADPQLAGAIALHHGSLAKETRTWIEDAIGEGRLQAVVCTSSLDLGVDFPPVEAVVQIGSPKGVARFLQRAGRSGHRPGGISRIHFVPTHGLELLEGAALRQAIQDDEVEHRVPVIRAFDVLSQWLCTRALGGGFTPDEARAEVMSTHAFATMTESEWQDCLRFIRSGGRALSAYDEFQRVEVVQGRWVMPNRSTARRHRMSIGTIVSDPMLSVKLRGTGTIGQVESSFIERMNAGDVFWFAGRQLEFVRIQGNVAEVKKAKRSTQRVPVWSGGRMPLTTELGAALRRQISAFASGQRHHPELDRIEPLLSLQASWSHVPRMDELLIESFNTEDGHHLCVFPFEGRAVHEGLAMVFCHRLGQIASQTITYACNDYGFELLSDVPFPVDSEQFTQLLRPEGLESDVLSSLNAGELARRRFREIAIISGMQHQPAQGGGAKHLQAHASLLFEVLSEHDPEHLLHQQALEEVLADQLQIASLHRALVRMKAARWLWATPLHPTPMSFPLVVDRLRGTITNEELESRIQRMAVAR